MKQKCVVREKNYLFACMLQWPSSNWPICRSPFISSSKDCCSKCLALAAVSSSRFYTNLCPFQYLPCEVCIFRSRAWRSVFVLTSSCHLLSFHLDMFIFSWHLSLTTTVFCPDIFFLLDIFFSPKHFLFILPFVFHLDIFFSSWFFFSQLDLLSQHFFSNSTSFLFLPWYLWWDAWESGIYFNNMLKLNLNSLIWRGSNRII